MGAVLAIFDERMRPENGFLGLERMRAAEPGRGALCSMRTPLGWIGVQRFANESFSVQACNRYLVFHGLLTWCADAPTRYRQRCTRPEALLDCRYRQYSQAGKRRQQSKNENRSNGSDSLLREAPISAR